MDITKIIHILYMKYNTIFKSFEYDIDNVIDDVLFKDEYIHLGIGDISVIIGFNMCITCDEQIHKITDITPSYIYPKEHHITFKINELCIDDVISEIDNHIEKQLLKILQNEFL